MNKNEKRFWELIVDGYCRSEAEAILKISKKESNKYFKNARRILKLWEKTYNK